MAGKGPGIGFRAQQSPVDASYLVLAFSAELTQERRFVPGTALSAVDGGANGDYTLNHAQVAAGDLHTEYALADKSRPSPWVAAADLAALSIADLGTRTHSLLTSLTAPADDHTQYLLITGVRAMTGALDMGGQDINNIGANNQALTSPAVGVLAASGDFRVIGQDIQSSAGTALQTFDDTAGQVSVLFGNAERIRIGEVPGTNPNDDDGIRLNATGAMPTSFLTFVSGAIAILGINDLNVGPYQAGSPGAQIRMDTRAGERTVTVRGYDGSTQITMFQVPMHPSLLGGGSDNEAFMRSDGCLLTVRGGTGSTNAIVDVQAITAGRATHLRTIPNGSPAGERSTFDFYIDDVIADGANASLLRIVANSTPELIFRSERQGTSILAPMIWQMDNAGAITEAFRVEIDAGVRFANTEIGFFGVAAVVRAGATDDIKDALTLYGLLLGGGATPLNLDGGLLSAGGATMSGNNTFGAFFTDISEIAAPANPAAGTRRLFTNSATGELSVRTSGGSTVSLEAVGAAPVGAQYLTLALDATLTAERRFVPGTALSAVDGGANGDYTLNHAQVATGDLHTEYLLVAGTRASTGQQAFNAGTLHPDNQAVTLGTSSDATILYDGTNLVINPAVVGTGFLSLAPLVTRKVWQVGTGAAVDAVAIAEISEVQTGLGSVTGFSAQVDFDNALGAFIELKGLNVRVRALAGSFSNVRGIDLVVRADATFTGAVRGQVILLEPQSGNFSLFGIQITTLGIAPGANITDLNAYYYDAAGTFNSLTNHYGLRIVGLTQGTNIFPIHATGGGRSVLQNIDVGAGDPFSLEMLRLGAGNSVAGADSDEGYVSFYLDDSAGAHVEFARLTAVAVDVTNTTKAGGIQIELMQNNTLRDYMHLAATAGVDTGTIVFNEDAQDIDFRIEGSTDVDLVHVDASVDAVGIGIALPLAKVHIDQASAAGAKPVLALDQGDIDDTFINFIGTSAADGSRSISSDTTEDAAKFGAYRVEINGVLKWVRIYDDES